jgi:hypothetical protein
MTGRRMAEQNKAPGRGTPRWPGLRVAAAVWRSAKIKRKKLRKKAGAKAGFRVAARRDERAARFV